MAQRKLLPRARRWHWRAPWLALCLLTGALAQAAGVNVEVRGVDEQLRTNVLAYLSFERYRKGGAELNADTVERLHNRVEREVQEALRPFGYYEPKVESTVTEQGHGEWRVVIDIAPGEPVRVQLIEVRVTGAGQHDALFTRILNHLPLHPGDRLNHALYEGLKGDLQRTAATYGYLDAKLIRNELVVDPTQHTADIALELETGERYRFGPTSIEQHVIRDSLVRRYLRYHQGDYYDLTQVLRTQFALDDSQYFANLEVQPQDPDRQARIVPLKIHADPSRRHRYSVGAGYATDTGVRGTLGFEDRHLNTLGHSFSVEVQAAQVTRYYVQSHYRIPVGDPALENISLNASIEQQILADVTATTQSAGPSFTHVSGPLQYVWQLNAVRSTTDDVNGSVTERLLVPEIDLASVPKGFLGEPQFVRPFFAELKGSDSALGSDANFIQLHMQAERVFHLSRRWHLLLRDEVGATLVKNFADLPAYYRFFAGGDNSVRGFAYNELSPLEAVCTQNPAGQFLKNGNTCKAIAGYIKTGGKDVFTGTVEVIRDLPRNLGIATFVDYGNALNSFQKAACLPGPAGQPEICTPFIQYSVGVGLRVRLPVMTLGIDIAQPLSVTAGPRLHINFSPKL
ncbi:MAG TPA: BamA/TamA family outer membrane protein [Steroidobacteraceae bacterium]|jgi:translocation and assembly module TamA|nr:BamA/TamA family outer membrane protein [Steroidobacteraceae bacterium]